MPKNTMLKLVKSADPLLVWRPQNRHVGGIVNLQKRILNLAKSSKQMVLVVFSVLILKYLMIPYNSPGQRPIGVLDLR